MQGLSRDQLQLTWLNELAEELVEMLLLQSNTSKCKYSKCYIHCFFFFMSTT